MTKIAVMPSRISSCPRLRACRLAQMISTNGRPTFLIQNHRYPSIMPYPPELLTQLNWKRITPPSTVWRMALPSNCGMDSTSTMPRYTPARLSTSFQSSRSMMSRPITKPPENRPSARKVCVCTSGSAPAQSASITVCFMERSLKLDSSKYSAGSTIAQPPINARWGMSRSAMTLEKRRL